MSAAPEPSADLQAWLDYIAQVNPRTIELGLERVAALWQALDGGKPGRHVITVAGTNGKGSCVAALERLGAARGLLTGCYTSPHIHQFNERIRLNGEPATDADIVSALASIEAARGDIRLSYFEFATLAALLLFSQAGLDLVILEVGLGGRLDAVNLIDPDVAVISSISLDHMDWLGSDREQIGREKAGIMRPGAPVVCSDPEPPVALLNQARDLGAPLYLINHEFSCVGEATVGHWHFSGLDARQEPYQQADLPPVSLHPGSLGAAMQALLCLDLLPEAPGPVLAGLSLAGRLEWRRHTPTGRPLLFDVAHNPAAAAHLGRQLRALKQAGRLPGRVAAVLAIMADKDIEGVISSLQSAVDIWYIAQVEEPRCMPAVEASQRVAAVLGHAVDSHSSVDAALQAALAATEASETILVTGSFYTVAALRRDSAEMTQAAS